MTRVTPCARLKERFAALEAERSALMDECKRLQDELRTYKEANQDLTAQLTQATWRNDFLAGIIRASRTAAVILSAPWWKRDTEKARAFLSVAINDYDAYRTNQRAQKNPK